MALTRRQREVLDFIVDFIRTRRYSPSLEEIAGHFGLSSVATVHKHVSNLEKKGFIRRDWNRSRSIDIATPELRDASRAGAMPAFADADRVADTHGVRGGGFGGGMAPASPGSFPGAADALHGGTHPAPYAANLPPDIVRLPLYGRVAAGQPIEAVVDEQSISVPTSMVGRGRSYVLEVKGDSMIGEHIQDGDYVIVEERSDVRDGEKVIALLDGEEATLKTYNREPDGSVRLDPANPDFEPIRVRSGDFRVQGVVIGVMRRYRS